MPEYEALHVALLLYAVYRFILMSAFALWQLYVILGIVVRPGGGL